MESLARFEISLSKGLISEAFFKSSRMSAEYFFSEIKLRACE